MANKKRYFLISLLIGMLFSVNSFAQSKYYNGDVSYYAKEVKQYGNTVKVDIVFELTALKIKTLRNINFTPILSDGINSISLPSISFRGRQNYISYNRSLQLMNKKQRNEYTRKYPHYKVFDQSEESTEKILYTISLPFESWLKRAHVDVIKDLSCCGQERMLERSQIVESINLEQEIALHQPKVYVEYIEPEVEIVKERNSSIEAYIEFKVNSHMLYPAFRNNKYKLDSLNAAINDIRQDRYTTINDIMVKGFASPEGNTRRNIKLSNDRTQAIVRYIKKKVTIPSKLYSTQNMGEAWDTLRQLIYDSRYDFRIDLLRIIDNEPDLEKRKREIARLDNGRPYGYLLEKIYPGLRKVVLDISFEVVPLDVSRAREVIKTRPINLSLNEMYQVANSYEKGSDEFNEVFIIAQRIFPDDTIARINAASSRLSLGDLATAEEFMYGVAPEEEIAEYYNVYGIIAMLNHQYTDAENYLNTAKEMGLEVADKNLSELYQIYRTLESQDQQRQRFAETTVSEKAN